MSATALRPALSPEVTNSVLRGLGFRFTTKPGRELAVAVFQSANRLDDERLVIDGDPGRRTSRLLREAAELRGGNNLSPHFGWDEWVCRGTACPGCRGVAINGPIVDAFEVVRDHGYDDGLHPLSGYRCPARNAATKGAAADSVHQYGSAGDMRPRLRWQAVTELEVFSGIGYSPSTGLVVHGDCRGVIAGTGRMAAAVTAPNRTGGTLARPTVFPDGR